MTIYWKLFAASKWTKVVWPTPLLILMLRPKRLYSRRCWNALMWIQDVSTWSRLMGPGLKLVTLVSWKVYGTYSLRIERQIILFMFRRLRPTSVTWKLLLGQPDWRSYFSCCGIERFHDKSYSKI